MSDRGALHSIASNDVDREVERYGVLTSPAGNELQALVELAAQIFEVPFAAINIITTTDQHQVATAGFEPAVCTRRDSMCAAVMAEPGSIVVADASQDPRFADNPFVTGRIGSVRFYASAPLTTPGGVTLGRLCVFDSRPRTSTREQGEALGILAGRVMDALELRLKNEQVEQSLLELTRARDELRRSNAALLDFAAQVSHDLRNPLMAVSANAELLSGEPAVAEDPELRAVVERIAEATRGMNAMIADVLRHAREGGRPQQEHTDLGALVHRVLADLEVPVREQRATVQVGPLPTVPGDPELLYSVVLNLLTNSLKFARPGVAPRVLVGATERAGSWRISVTDNGIGVPEGHERSVFLPYVRAHEGGEHTAGAATHREGYGIGLATVHRVVTAHGGRVGLGPAPGGGTTVWFELPADGREDRASHGA